MRRSLFGGIVGLFALVAFILPATANIPLVLVRGVVVTLPDWVSYYARAKGGIKKSEDGRVDTIANDLLLSAIAEDGDATLNISISTDASFLTAVPAPNDAVNFTLDKFGKAFERRAVRDTPGGNGTVQRISIQQSKAPDGSAVIDHEYLLLGQGSDTKGALYRHEVYLFKPNGVAVLQIEYPLAMQKKWRGQMEDVARSFKPAQ